MPEVRLRCKVNTPLFLGDADQKAELRTPSIIGELRYWFRALAGKVCDNNLFKVKIMEEAVFGSQRRAGIRIHVESDLTDNDIQVCDLDTPGIRYLAGMGITADCREYIKEDFAFTIVMTGPNILLKAAYNIFLVWTRYGGLGARARKGFGCINAIDGSDIPEGYLSFLYRYGQEGTNSWNNHYDTVIESFKSLRDFISARLSTEERIHWDAPFNTPTYLDSPSFTRYARIIYRLDTNNVLNAMNRVGMALRNFRIDGHPTTSDYRDTIRPLMQGMTPTSTDLKNDVFGLPIPYRSNTLGLAKTVSWDGTGSGDNRRASPMHINFSRLKKENDVIFIYVTLIVFKSRFLPDGKSVTVDATTLDTPPDTKEVITRLGGILTKPDGFIPVK